MEHASYFSSFLKDEVNLNQSRLDKLGSRVDAVYKALCADSTLGPAITGKSKQGSWAHRLIIRPRSGGDFDADFFLHFPEQDGWEPKQYPDEIYNALHRDSIYSKQAHGRKCRCVWLKYAPENGIGCHLDIVPFVALKSQRNVIVNRDDNTWEPMFGSTSPQGFTDWVKRRDELTDGQFRKVVRLMKYLKRQQGSFNGVRSVILTTALGLQVTELSAFSPSRYCNLPTTLINVVEDLDLWLQSHTSKPSLLNPAGDGTNFDHRWSDETYLNFRTRIHDIAEKMRKAFDETDVQDSAALWKELFGDKFNPPAAKTSSSANPFAGGVLLKPSSSSRYGRSG